jgi:hypothetical protein
MLDEMAEVAHQEYLLGETEEIFRTTSRYVAAARTNAYQADLL